MVERCKICPDIFWIAVSHCQSPVYLANKDAIDLRTLSATEKHGLVSAPAELELIFNDRQDYIRFVLAYIIIGGRAV